MVTIDSKTDGPDYYVVIPYNALRELRGITSRRTHQFLRTLFVQSKDEGVADHIIITFPLIFTDFKCSVHDEDALDKKKPWTFIPNVDFWTEGTDLGLDDLTCKSGDPDKSYIWHDIFRFAKDEVPEDGTNFEVRFVNVCGKTITTGCVKR